MYAALLVFAATSALAAAQPLFSENFDAAEPGAKLPAALKVINGGFAVVAEGGQRFLELPGAPLDTFGVLFGPAAPPPVSATARFFGTKKGRKLPAFGISLGGAGGYRLQVSAAKDALEIFKADAAVASASYKWKSGTWVHLRISVIANAGQGATIRGKAWPDGTAEPAVWGITYEDKDSAKLPEGSAGVWGNPFSGTPIRFDDLAVEAAKP